MPLRVATPAISHNWDWLLSRYVCPLLVVVLLGLAACGGGGSDPASAAPPSPIDTNPPPPPVEGLRFRRDTSSVWNRQMGEMAAGLVGGGLAAADYDGDGDVDLYVVGGEQEPNRLYENQGNGTYVERAVAMGLDLTGWSSGPAFGDIDADGDLDLFVGGINATETRVFENRLDESARRFIEITDRAGIDLTTRNTVSATFFDYDNDGWLDLATTHWTNLKPGADTQTLWRNQGDGTFAAATLASGIAATLLEGDIDFTFTPNFSDIDRDGDGDLLMASDYHESQVFLNNGDGTFLNITDNDVITDQAGMGAAVGDFDNDGDMDWFVTSIYNIDEGGNYFGNRMYRNDGDGVFADATLGVADGGWGWGACAADFDNDGLLDIAQVNGWTVEGKWDYTDDNVRFFHNVEPEILRFEERAEEIGIVNESQGRGIACFDMDRDGLLDIVISNNAEDNIVVYRNETNNANHYLGVRLQGRMPNRFGVGAWITVSTPEQTQVREMGGSSNYVSHDPLEVHFGLGSAQSADVHVVWPDGSESDVRDVAADQLMTIEQPLPVNRLVVLNGEGGGTFAVGDEVQIAAEPPAEGYHFSHWQSDNGGSFVNPLAANTVFLMPSGRVRIAANYVPGVAPSADVSAARRWIEVLLTAIRNDYARPTVHARNLFHTSAAMYDAWAIYDDTASTWLFGRSEATSVCTSDSLPIATNLEAARVEALSYAAWRIIRHRFALSPGSAQTAKDADALMGYLGFDVDDAEINAGSPAALGLRIANCYIDFGLADGANEAKDYANLTYEPVNEPLQPHLPGNPHIQDLNRWQPLSLLEFIDQAGNPADSTPDFIGAEWGRVAPFALSTEDLTIRSRSGNEYWVYHDPGSPPMMGSDSADHYKWSHSMVAIWSSHLDPTDGVMWDISPASIGNVSDYPAGFDGHAEFFDVEGGDTGRGYSFNPVTNVPYEPQVVPRGDYTRALAEFWADGPDSETPPGHWYVILNEINEHPSLERKFRGQGSALDLLEWDIKAYFALGGAVHDAAIAAWSVKGWYDYIRPISALRAMSDLGQSTDTDLASFHAQGLPLRENYIELITADDPLAGDDGEHVGKIKLFAWRGPDHVPDPATDIAGVGWILAENWWPYQRPTFVTPPFAGYVSGHSTFSRAAAEVLTALTGDAYFPGGMSEFRIEANEFLVFEEGPSVGLTLQWATYRDAADQCSLSRIWGGIHPPADDIPGRLIGERVGRAAFVEAKRFFTSEFD